MQRLVNPKFQILDDNGAPLVGGWVHTYEAGTTTPKATYKDRALSALQVNSNPIELDSRGECLIFCTGLLKIYVTDSVGSAVYPAPLDNMLPSEPGALEDTDGDTGIEVEQSPDEDRLRMRTAGIEKLVIDSLGIRPAIGYGIVDTDGDTGIYVERTTGDKHVRMDADGSEIVTVNSSGLSFTSGARITSISDDQTMAADSATLCSTQRAIKHYIDHLSPIPSDSHMWFYTNATMTGWALVPVVDAVLYSASTGIPGGAQRAGGSWTISGLTADAHTHAGPLHTHTVAHNHGGTSGTPSTPHDQATAAGSGQSNASHTHTIPSQTPTTSTDGSGPTAAANYNGVTSSAAWRPVGYVNTLQRKL